MDPSWTKTPRQREQLGIFVAWGGGGVKNLSTHFASRIPPPLKKNFIPEYAPAQESFKFLTERLNSQLKMN